ncbi:MAG: transcription elongation factor GreA [Salibacteraceae bacterium]|jgi:transcription elongation factor GreA
MSDISYYTEEGLATAKAELLKMEKVDRPFITVQIADARDKGDLSENAEYHAAKEAQGMLEAKISLLKNDLSNARILDDSNLDLSKALILSIVKIKNVANGAIMTYTLVAPQETNLAAGKISVKSPIGKGLLGTSVGEIAEVSVPTGIMKFEILEISR